MMLKIGTQVWIPCEVKPGPFSNERLVRIGGEEAKWMGFVQIHWLKDNIEEGPTSIRGRVLGTQNGTIEVCFPGAAALTHSLYIGPAEQASSCDSLQT